MAWNTLGRRTKAIFIITVLLLITGNLGTIFWVIDVPISSTHLGSFYCPQGFDINDELIEYECAEPPYLMSNQTFFEEHFPVLFAKSNYVPIEFPSVDFSTHSVILFTTWTAQSNYDDNVIGFGKSGDYINIYVEIVDKNPLSALLAAESTLHLFSIEKTDKVPRLKEYRVDVGPYLLELLFTLISVILIIRISIQRLRK